MTQLMKPEWRHLEPRNCCFKRESPKVSMFKDSNAGNPPGTDGVDKEFLTRYWSLLGQTVHYAQRTFIDIFKSSWKYPCCCQTYGSDHQRYQGWQMLRFLSDIFQLLLAFSMNSARMPRIQDIQTITT